MIKFFKYIFGLIRGFFKKKKKKYRILFRRTRNERRENGRFVDQSINASFTKKYKHLL